jgi:hypothetical protein
MHFLHLTRQLSFSTSNGMARPRIPVAVVGAQRSRPVGLFAIFIIRFKFRQSNYTSHGQTRQGLSCVWSMTPLGPSCYPGDKLNRTNVRLRHYLVVDRSFLYDVQDQMRSSGVIGQKAWRDIGKDLGCEGNRCCEIPGSHRGAFGL